MIKLYQFASCPYCKRVRRKLDELDLEYKKIEVPRDRSQRTTIKELSGQLKVPVLQDEDGTVVYDSKRINKYLERQYN